MNAKQLVVAAALGASSLVGTFIVEGHVADAQSTTTGAVQGVLKEESTGEALVGVTVVASSAALQGTQTAITDENGFYRITNLPPGDYIITFYYADLEVRRSGVKVGVQKTTPVFQKLNTTGAGEKIEVVGHAPTIDPTSTSQGITLDQEYTKNIPVPGRTFEAALGAAAGSQADPLGVSFSGSSSLENQYYVDGVNTTGLGFGTVGTPVINDFIEEIEVITGGYNAEFGRSTGGVVNVVTKSGSNDFKGSVFGYITPGLLIASRERTPTQASAIDAEGNTAYEADFGFEVGGPIIKDKVWFYVGFAPAFNKVDITRRVKRRTDCRVLLDSGDMSECNTDPASGIPDGIPDTDQNGFYITDDVDQDPSTPGVQNDMYSSSSRAYNIVSKINFAVSPEHQGQISEILQPARANQQGVYGMPTTNQFYGESLTNDTSFKWTSKFNDNKTEVEAVIGYHYGEGHGGSRDVFNADIDGDPANGKQTMNDARGQVLVFGNLGTWSNLQDPDGVQAESMATRDACTDNTALDPYPLIENCPDEGIGYSIGGPGGVGKRVEDRRSIKLSVTQRLKAFGSHEIKAGGDLEDNTYRNDRVLSGGAFLTNVLGSYVESQRWVQLAPPDTDPSTTRFDNECREPDPESPTGGTKSYQCDYLGGHVGDPGTRVEGPTFNWSAYIRDSWQILPNLTLNAGLRYEEQRLRYATHLQNRVDPLTGNYVGKNAMVLRGMLAPRLGLLYDWTKEGRSKIYAHWGRFYESIPSDINDRSFGGEVQFQQYWSANPADPMNNQCGPADPAIGGVNGNGCLEADGGNGVAALAEFLFGSSGVLVAPGIKAQYLDEALGGIEYEIMDDLKIGIAIQHRTLGRVIEDVSTDGAQTYIIANPGEWSESEQRKLEEQIAMTVDDPNDPNDEHDRLTQQLELYKGIRMFDKPSRDYNALQFTATRRFSKNLYLQGSYTYSRSKGNFPGLISNNNGQVDPNISSQYDLIELLANRYGALPGDRPHYIKIDGYYTFDLKKAGDLTVGARFRALSGTAIDALGGHYLYGPNEAFLLPRGSIGRSDFEHSLAMHFGYGHDLSHGMKIEVFGDVYNIYNRQGQASVDDTYAFKLPDNNANPISGGSYEDLVFSKAIDDDGNETSTPLKRNPNFGNTAGRYAPLSVQLGMRLTF